MTARIEEAIYWLLIVAILAGAVWWTLPVKRVRGAEPPAYCYSNKHGLAYPCREDPRQGMA